LYYVDDALEQGKKLGRVYTWMYLFWADLYATKAFIFSLTGDYEKAQASVEQAESNLVFSDDHDWSNMVFGKFHMAKAVLFFGQVRDREFRESIDAAINYFQKSMYGGPFIPACQKFYIDMLIRNGSLIEAELYAREALRYSLTDHKFASPTLVLILGSLTTVYSEMGRASEAEDIARAGLEIRERSGMPVNSEINLLIEIDLLNALVLQNKWDEAAKLADKILALTTSGDRLLSQSLQTSPLALFCTLNASVAYIKSGRFEYIDEHFDSVQAQAVKMLGEDHYIVAEFNALKGVSCLEQGEVEKAHALFASAVPMLLRTQGVGESRVNRYSQKMRLSIIAEAYLRLLSTSNNTEFEKQAEKSVLTDGFRLAESAKASVVNAAIQESSARAAALEPNLKELIRNDQDFHKQIESLTVALSRQLGQTGNLRNETVMVALRTRIDTLRQKRIELSEIIKKGFPEYKRLTRQSFPDVDEVTSLLRPGEALISIYIGEDRSYVWALPKNHPAQFAAVDIGREKIGETVKSLRSALVPDSVKTVGDIPQFDVVAACYLYKKLLEPVEEGWKGANTLIVVPHGATGYFPMSLLVTEPFGVGPGKSPDSFYEGPRRSTPSAARKDRRGLFADRENVPLGSKADKGPVFSEYRDVPWLARTHAIMTLPSVASLKALREGKDCRLAQRPFVGFGDPFFREEHAEEESSRSAVDRTASGKSCLDLRISLLNQPVTRSLNSASIEVLPRLPETRDEIKAIAEVLGADPKRDLFFGREANEHNAKTTALHEYQIVSFATHGLMAGDLDGLNQPALALASPKVAKIDGDGLLTMDEVLGLRLNADWVLLSACNTGAGEEAGAEAVSGLGRAFFYAGAKALLVSNWPVNSKATTELMTTLFRKKKEDLWLTRAEALQEAEMVLMDGAGFVDSNGQTLYSYAHPIFWAPFVLVGEGG
jgi:CHAT domain-containing protein